MEDTPPIPPAEALTKPLTPEEAAAKAEEEFQKNLATDIAMKNRWGRRRVERVIKR